MVRGLASSWARVIPIGDGLGRVLAEILKRVKRFYRTAAVPACDHWDTHEHRPRPRAPYLLQAMKHPSGRTGPVAPDAPAPVGTDEAAV